MSKKDLVSISLPRASRNFPDVKARNDFFSIIVYDVLSTKNQVRFFYIDSLVTKLMKVPPTVTRKFPVNSNGRMERLMCNFHYFGRVADISWT